MSEVRLYDTEHCPTCGSLVSRVTSDEGTSYYKAVSLPQHRITWAIQVLEQPGHSDEMGLSAQETISLALGILNGSVTEDVR